MLQQLIDKYIKQNESITEFLSKTSDLYQNGQEVLPLLADKLTETHFNPELGNSFAELLQLSDNEEIVKQFELDDISRLYESLIALQHTNIETYINAAYFEFNVMDDSRKAKGHALGGLKMAKKRIEQLESLLNKIDEEEI